MVFFQQMSQKNFDAYLIDAIKEYAKDLESAGFVSQGQGETAAKNQLENILPQGIHTHNFYLYDVINEKNETIGCVIYGLRAKGEAFIVDIQIKPQYQGFGYGKQTMQKVEEEAKSKGFTRISLHVFGHNLIARNLYSKLNYEITSMQMSKKL